MVISFTACWLIRPFQERSTQIFLGILFAARVVVTFLPKGIAGLLEQRTNAKTDDDPANPQEATA